LRLHTPALVDDLNALPSNGWLQSGALERDSLPARLFRSTNSTGFKRSSWIGTGTQLILWNVETVALTVAESVEDCRAETVIVTDPLDQRIRLAPVLVDEAPFGHRQCVFRTRLEHLFYMSCYRLCPVFAGDSCHWWWRRLGVMLVTVMLLLLLSRW
jgi:hypothetical protein